MSFRNTAILAVVVALLGGYLYWVERPAVEEESRTAHLLEFDPADVTGLELRTPHETVKIEKRGEGWQIVAPIDAAADSRAVESLIRTAAEAERKRTLADATGDLAAYGLETPDAELRLQTSSGSLPALAIGKGTPIGFNAYARRGDEPAVLLTGGTVRTALVKTLVDLRQKEILHLSPDDVTALTLKPRNGPEVHVERDDGKWMLTAPIHARASDASVRNLLGSLQALRAVDFVNESGPEAETSRGLSPAALEVDVDAGESPIRVLVGDQIDQGDRKVAALAVAGSPQIYLVPSQVPASLGKTADALRDKTLLDVDPADVAQIHVHRGDGESFDLARHDQAWSLTGEAETDELVAKRFVDDVLGLSGDEVVSEENDLTAGGLAQPVLEIELADADGKDLATLLIGRETTNGAPTYRAALEGRGPVYTIRDYVYARLDKRPQDLAVSAVPSPAAAGEAPAAEVPANAP